MSAIKKGVSILGLKPEMVIGTIIAKSIFDNHNFVFVITSGTEWEHGDYSRHYLGYAIDVRSSDIPTSPQKHTVLKELRIVLGDEFKATLEHENETGEHYHISYKPKQRTQKFEMVT